MVELIRNDTLPAARRLSYVRYMKSMAVTLHKATADTSLFPGDWTRAANPGGDLSRMPAKWYDTYGVPGYICQGISRAVKVWCGIE